MIHTELLNNMTYEEFITDVWAEVAKCPKSWRKGQSVFNVIDEKYGVARTVQFEDGVDCFYDDREETINLFIAKCWLRMVSDIHPKPRTV